MSPVDERTPAELATNALRRLKAVPARRDGWVPGHPSLPESGTQWGDVRTARAPSAAPPAAPLQADDRAWVDSLESWTSSLAVGREAVPEGDEPAGGTRSAGAHRPEPRSRRVIASVARVGALLIPDTVRGGRMRVSLHAVLALGVVVLVAVGVALVPLLRSDGAAGVEAARRPEAAVVSGGTASGSASAGAASARGSSADPAVAGGGQASAPTTLASPGALVLVHVVGRVARPGVVSLPTGSRVADALAAAGGPTPEADVAAVNLARVLVDGEQMRVPAPGEELAPQPAPPVGGSAPGTGGGPGGGAGGTPGGLLDLNLATESELDGLPGVGPVLAERIVAWRTTNGGFRSVDELQEVSGIGERTFAEIAPRVRV